MLPEGQIDHDRSLFTQQVGVDARHYIGCLRIRFNGSGRECSPLHDGSGQLRLGEQVLTLGGQVKLLDSHPCQHRGEAHAEQQHGQGGQG